MEETRPSPLNTALEQPAQRGLSRMLHSAFGHKVNTYPGFIEHFGIVEVVKKLSAKVRGKVLVTCNGGGDPERAAKQNAEIVAMTIESMLKDGLVTPDDICKEISTDHMVEVLPHQDLYHFLFGEVFSNKNFTQDVLEIILQESMLGVSTAVIFMRAVGDDKIINESTPSMLLALCQLEMLKLNRDGKTFKDEEMLQIYTPKELVLYVSPRHLFAAVQAVAELNGWLEKKGLPEGVVTPSEFPPAESSPPPLPRDKKEKRPKKRNSTAPDDEPEVTTAQAAGDDGAELTLDIDDEDADGTASAQS